MEETRVLLDRGGAPESEHRVIVAVWRDGSLAASAGDVDRPTLLRSAAKPVQALASVLTGAAERFEMSPREIAVTGASHSGEPFHVEAVRALLARLELTEADLLCGTHAPIHAPSGLALAAAGREPGDVHNNCSGKHAGMLAACSAAGWETATYTAPDHPLQRMNLANVTFFAGADPDGIDLVVDGCSVPAFSLPLVASARMYARFTSPARTDGIVPEVAAAASRVLDAMAAHPEMVGGTGRVDTDVIRVTGGRVIAKVGAEGAWCLGVRERNLGIAVKCLDGASRATYPVGLAVLRTLGELSEHEWEALARHHDSVLRNHRGLEIGKVSITPAEGVRL